MTGRRKPSGPSRARPPAGRDAPDFPGTADFPKGEPLPNTCSGEVLADLFGITERTLRDLADDGKAVKVGRGLYDRDASIRLYVVHLRNVASGRGGDDHVANLTAERARLAKEQADSWAKRNAVAAGDLIPAAEVGPRWQAILAGVRSRMLAVPSRLRHRCPHLTATDVAALDRELRDALTEAADADPA